MTPQGLSPPEIVLLDAHAMTREYYRDALANIPASGIDSRVIALYNFDDSENGRIYLLHPNAAAAMITSGEYALMQAKGVEPVRNSRYGTSTVSDSTLFALTNPSNDYLEKPVFQEQLLHELIHHVQYQSGAYRRFPCRAYGEKQAYQLGGKYLKAHYTDDPLPNRKFWAHVYSRC